MHVVPAKHICALWVLVLLASACPVWAEEDVLRVGRFEEASSIGSALRVNAADGVIDARIREITLAQVLRTLETRIGLHSKLHDPSMAGLPISVELRSVPLEQALPVILEGFSYAIYPVDSTLGVSILSTPPKSHGKNRQQITVSSEESLALPSGEALEPQEGEPLSLDEFQAIAPEEQSGPSLDASEEGSNNPSSDPESQQRYHEGVVDRALAALASGHHHLKQEAINQLASLEDPRATEALLQAVNGNLGIDPPLRIEAVAALGRNAAEQGLARGEAVDTLQRLAQGSDAELRSIAKEALGNMRQTEQAQSAP